MLSLLFSSLLSTVAAQRTRVVEPSVLAAEAAVTPAPKVETLDELDPRAISTYTTYWESTSWEDDEWYDVWYFSKQYEINYSTWSTPVTIVVTEYPTTSPDYVVFPPETSA